MSSSETFVKDLCSAGAAGCDSGHPQAHISRRNRKCGQCRCSGGGESIKRRSLRSGNL